MSLTVLIDYESGNLHSAQDPRSASAIPSTKGAL